MNTDESTSIKTGLLDGSDEDIVDNPITTDTHILEGNFQSLLLYAQDCLVQSNLIFLLADLRVLSATGRIHTKFEAVSVESDDVTRTDARTVAGLDQKECSCKDQSHKGLSPAQ
eukprot:2687279-Ditylum_brightwellii.AAC.1